MPFMPDSIFFEGRLGCIESSGNPLQPLLDWPRFSCPHPMLNTVPQLLAALGWPSEAGQEPGTLMWNRAIGEGASTHIYSASVVVTPKAVVCRMRSTAVSQPSQMKTHMEAIWDIQTHQPYMTKWSRDGQPESAYVAGATEKALTDFREAVEALDVAPKLQLVEQVNRRSR